MSAETLELGVARLPVTPARPLRLAGYANRVEPYGAVREDIFVRVHYHCLGERRLVFVYGDLIWWGDDFITAMRDELASRFGLEGDEVFFFASHNHSGPPTSARFLPLLETYNDDYAVFLRQRVADAVAAAGGDAEPVTVWRHDGLSDLNVYRRRMHNGVAAMLPNYDVPADRRLTALSYRRADGGVKGITVSYSCHANVAAENSLHPDYPGIALRLLDASRPGCVSLFLQGCTADLRPNSALGRRFSSRGYDEAAIFAEDFRDDCEAALATAGTELAVDFTVTRREVPLPLVGRKSIEETRALLSSPEEAERQWAARVLAHGGDGTPRLELGRISFAPGLVFHTFSSETSQDYAAFARTLEPGAVAVSCANGMIGYLPTAKQISVGGYEPEESALYFALPGLFPAEVEEIVHGVMREMKGTP